MEKIDVGIISNCRSFRIALDTILKGESDGEVNSSWCETERDFTLKMSRAALTQPKILILDTDNIQIPIHKLLEKVRHSLRKVKLIVLLGKRKIEFKLVNKYQIDKILKRSCSESELLSAVRSCADNLD